MSEWREHKLGDFIEVKHGFAFSGTGITDQPTRNILVTPGNFNIGGGFKNSKFKYFNYEFPNEYILKTGDIVVTMTDLSQETDTLGYAAKIPMYDGINFLHNQRIGLVQFKGSEANEDFIYWLMRTKEYQSFIVGSASGTSIMHTSPSRIKEYQFLLPSRSEQTAIAEVLSSLDDKIDLLHRQNKTLEQLAETLFRQWFVEDEWNGTLTEYIKVQGGFAFKSKDFKEAGFAGIVKIKNISMGSIDITNTDFVDQGVVKNVDKRFKINSGDFLIAMTGAEIGKIGIVEKTEKEIWVNQRVGKLEAKVPYGDLIGYLALKSREGQEHIINACAGSAQENISSSGIEEMAFPGYDKEKVKSLGEEIRPLFDKIIFNQSQIRTLTQLRDTLLPKLMSGEVRVR
ncbi:MAG: restriction endonuclease subunit S [Flammeovirgaceae bacterium]|jgi:type I restriction enzyme S subunit|nr:restriction endonuclease subunit S [Flammeovirgaceae bacterium]